MADLALSINHCLNAGARQRAHAVIKVVVQNQSAKQQSRQLIIIKWSDAKLFKAAYAISSVTHLAG
ncbi:hypothetical protein CCR75_001631 [Bremia lactucae]|uniref:Uncharacterized protein n=1 Tax=Bremia lactucae TaxID=4779 RepID=A0A976IFV0_BRELC|nr:hypothetical protein CCR75_001631 [Bremia lactucae]